jgi:hypothetical protein
LHPDIVTVARDYQTIRTEYSEGREFRLISVGQEQDDPIPISHIQPNAFDGPDLIGADVTMKRADN